MKLTRLIVLTVALVFAWATAGFAAHSPETCVKRIDSFNYLVDYSGSMMMAYKGGDAGKTTKIALAKQAIDRVNAAVPDLGYSGGLYTFAPYMAFVDQSTWDRGQMAEGIAAIESDLDVFGRFTPMGPGLVEHDAVIKSMAPKAAVIIVSDGEANRGVDPVEEAKAIYSANPDVCFHIISVADSAEGQQTLEEIAALSSCAVLVKASDLVASDAAVDKFVGDVFCMPMTEEVIVLRGVNFAFDSSELDAAARAVLDEAADHVKDMPNLKLVLLGYTDSVGTDAYNLGLSQRRANSVKAYLAKAGVPASAMVARGMGKSFRYDNATEEGRFMNRRCELTFEE